MLRRIKNWFSKTGIGNIEVQAPENKNAKFILKVDGIAMAELEYKKEFWHFKYTEEFKKVSEKYNLIVGFRDINKEYKSEILWPFFQIRIPGLKQPAIKEILENEHLNENNEVELLKRFGKRSISNPYELVYS
jgi:HipA-like protein